MRKESETFTDYLVEEGHVVDPVMPVSDVVLARGTVNTIEIRSCQVRSDEASP